MPLSQLHWLPEEEPIIRSINTCLSIVLLRDTHQGGCQNGVKYGENRGNLHIDLFKLKLVGGVKEEGAGLFLMLLMLMLMVRQIFTAIPPLYSVAGARHHLMSKIKSSCGSHRDRITHVKHTAGW